MKIAIPKWTPQLVHEKLDRVTPLINARLPSGVFVQCTKEIEDDIPVMRLLTGPRDPYTAERFGSFAFYSTQRGMEWYLKQFGKADFVPYKGMVYVTYYNDSKLKEEVVFFEEIQTSYLLLESDDETWARNLTSLFDVG